MRIKKVIIVHDIAKISPVFAYTVVALPGDISPTSVPALKRPIVPVATPLSSIRALIPELAARTIGRLNSTERILAMARCWCGATVSPNQASFVTFTSHCAPERTLSLIIPGNTAS
jgi:hypothetical protein